MLQGAAKCDRLRPLGTRRAGLRRESGPSGGLAGSPPFPTHKPVHR